MTSNLTKVRPSDFLKVIKEGSKALRELKKVHPRDRYVLLYPDSDNAFVGMGFNLLNTKPAEEVYQTANKLLDRDILRLCLEGPKNELFDSLENKHLATFVTSHATMAKLAHEREHLIQICKGAGGIGVGFINTLVFSGAISFEDGLDLVRQQARAMEKAASMVPNAKLRLRLRPATHKVKMCIAASEHCLKQGIPKEVAVCSVTRQLYPNVIEVAGHEEAIKYLEKEGQHLFEFRRIGRVVKNPKAYHTQLMEPASEFIRYYIEQKLKENPDYLKDPSTCSVYSSTSGIRLRTKGSIKKDLCNYPKRPILVEQLLNCMFARPHDLAQPNIFVLWDRNLMNTLSRVNRKARSSAKLLKA